MRYPREPRITLLPAILYFSFTAAFPGPGVPESGAPAPDVVAETLAHGKIALDDLRGKVVLLQFWASWCQPCIDGLPDLKALYERHADDGFEIVGISLDQELKPARRAISAHDLDWPQICDGRGKDSPIAQSYGVRGTPRFVLIDRRGLIAAPYVRPKELESELQALLAAE